MSVTWFSATPIDGGLPFYLLSAVGSGVCIGATGIGGVLLVPLLCLIGVPIGAATPAVLASLLLPGIVALATNRRILPYVESSIIGCATVPGALAGSLLFPALPPIALACSVAALAIASGVRTVYNTLAAQRQSCATPSITTKIELPRMPATDPEAGSTAAAPPVGTTTSGPDTAWAFELPMRTAASVGVAVGFFSVLTCTGGPFIAIPLLFHIGPSLPPTQVIALAQTLCIPISLCSIAMWTLTNGLDAGLACAIGIATAVGVPCGARIGLRAKPAHLKAAIGVVLIAVGTSFAGSTLCEALSRASATAEAPAAQSAVQGALESDASILTTMADTRWHSAHDSAVRKKHFARWKQPP